LVDKTDTVKLWALDTHKETAAIPRPSWPSGVAFSQGGLSLAISGNAGIDLWSVEPLKKLRTLVHRRERTKPQRPETSLYATPVFFADDSRTLFGGRVSGDGPVGYSLGIWDAAEGQLRETVAEVAIPDHFAVSSDGRALVASHSGAVSLWDAVTGQERVRLSSGEPGSGWEERGPFGFAVVHGRFDWEEPGGAMGAVAVAAQGKAIAFASQSGKVLFFDCSALLTDGKPVATGILKPGSTTLPDAPQIERVSLADDTSQVQHVSFSHDGKRLFVAGAYRPNNAGKDLQKPLGFVGIWDVAAKQNLGVIPTPGRMRFGHHDGADLDVVVAIAPSPDGKLLAVATASEIALWDPTTFKKVCVVGPLDKDGLGLRDVTLKFSAHGRRLAISAHAHTWIWDVPTRQTVVRVKGGGGVTFFADGKYFATAEYLNRIHLWETATGKQLAADHAMMGILRGVGVSQDNRWLVAGGEGGAAVWRIGNVETTPTLKRHGSLDVTKPVYGVAFSADGTRALTCGGAHEIWETPAGRRVASFPAEIPEIQALYGDLSHDGKTAVVVGKNHLYLWRP